YLFFFQAEDGIRDDLVTGVQTCALPISRADMVRLIIAHPELKLLQKLQTHGPVQLKLFGQGITSTQITKTAAGQSNIESYTATRSEERRVGKEWSTGWVRNDCKRRRNIT